MVKSVRAKQRAGICLSLALLTLLASRFGVAETAAAAPPPKPRWVEQVYLDPASISLAVNEDLHVVLGRTGYAPSDLEFRIHQTRNSEWFILRDWTGWPLAPLQSAVVGSSAIQVDIRHKDGGEVQKEWLGTYFFRQPTRSYPSLYRVISSTLFEIDDRGDLSKKTAARAKLLFSLLADEKGESCLTECKRALQKDGLVEIKTGDMTVIYNPEQRRVSWPEAPIDINLGRFTQYSELQKSLREIDPSVDDQTLLIAFAVQFVHRGFWVGSPAEGMIRSHFDVVSMCNTFSFTLIRMLGELGIDAEFVSYQNALGGAHAIVQVKTGRGTLLLDAMEGSIVFGSVDEIIKGVEVRQLALPSFQHTGIDLVADLPASKGVWISKSIDLNRGQAMHQNPVIIDPRLISK